MSVGGCVNHPAITTGLAPCSACGVFHCPDCLVLLQGRPLCAACKSATLRDVRSGTQGSGLPLADIGMRFLAQLVDGFILGLGTLLVVLAVGGTAGLLAGGKGDEAMMAGVLAGYATLFLLMPVQLLYEALMLMRYGQTLGKMACGLRVVSADGSRISTGQAFGRAAVRMGLGLLSCIGILVDYVPAFTTPERTCTHDVAARTRVVSARDFDAMRRR